MDSATDEVVSNLLDDIPESETSTLAIHEEIDSATVPPELATQSAVKPKRPYTRRKGVAIAASSAELDNKSSTLAQSPHPQSTASTGTVASLNQSLSSNAFANIQAAVNALPESAVSAWLIPELMRVIGAWDYRKIFRVVREEYGEAGIYRVLKMMIVATKGERHGMIRVAAAAEVSNARTSGRGIDLGKNDGIAAVDSVMQIAAEAVEEAKKR